MATQTTNYNLTKPAGSERFDVTTWNANMDTIDAAIKEVDELANVVNGDLDNKISKSGDTMDGVLVAQSNTDYTVAQVRNITLSTREPTASDIEEGAIWAVYE